MQVYFVEINIHQKFNILQLWISHFRVNNFYMEMLLKFLHIVIQYGWTCHPSIFEVFSINYYNRMPVMGLVYKYT